MNHYNPNIHHRKSIRLKDYDYSREGLYYVTICCKNRASLFGYIVNNEDNNTLDLIEYELEALEVARKYVKQYSYREVSNWLSTFTERYISHIGLMKRVKREQKRKNKARTLRVWSEYAEKAIQAAKKLEEERTSSRA